MILLELIQFKFETKKKNERKKEVNVNQVSRNRIEYSLGRSSQPIQ